MNIRVRSFGGFKVSLETSSSDLSLINQTYALQDLAADDIHVRQARVAHNQHDRTLERFQKAQLERFAETLPGKSLLPGHNTEALPLGRWFRADTRTRTEEFPVLRTDGKAEGKAAGAEIIPGFEPTRQRVTWLEAAFYIVADASTEGMRKSIDSGVYQDVSIGFRFDDIDCDVCRTSYLRSECPHWRGQWIEDLKRLVTLTYSGDPKKYEARETSIVYLGAQQQAELMKALRTGTVDPQRLAQTPWGVDLVELKRYEALARIYGHQQKAWAFPGLKSSVTVGSEADLSRLLGAFALEEPSADAGGDPDPEDTGKSDQDPPVGDPATTTAQAVKEAEMALLEEMRKRLGLPETADEAAVLAAAETAKASADAKAQADTDRDGAKALAAVGTQALKDAAKEYVDHCIRLGQPEAEAALVAEAFTGKQDYAGLRALVDQKFAAVCEKFPNTPRGKVLDEEKTGRQFNSQSVIDAAWA